MVVLEWLAGHRSGEPGYGAGVLATPLADCSVSPLLTRRTRDAHCVNHSATSPGDDDPDVINAASTPPDGAQIPRKKDLHPREWGPRDGKKDRRPW